MVIQLFALSIMLLVVPAAVGGIFVGADRRQGRLLFRWVGGQILLWAGFQLICVPLILKERSFEEMVWLFGSYMAALLLLAAAKGIRGVRSIKGIRGIRSIRGIKGIKRVKGIRGGASSITQNRKLHGDMHVAEYLLWALFWGLLLFQLTQAVRLAYADGDDAYYVAVSAITQDADTMYRKLPYTGGETELDVRHGLAPFPIWISFLARVSGMRTVSVAQAVLPAVLIAMSYAILYLFAVRLFTEQRKQALFLIFAELLVLFGDDSFYTVENFMIARSRQGKAALGSIVIPFLLLLLMILMNRLQNGERVPLRLYLLLGATAAAGCLCSTLGALLLGLAVGTVGLLIAVCYRQLRCLMPLAVCCVPCVCYALLYLLAE